MGCICRTTSGIASRRTCSSPNSPGLTLTNINQLLTVCLDIEHSFIGDL